MVITQKLQKELEKLVDIASLKDYKLNFATILNILQEHKYDLNYYQDIVQFFTKNGIDIISDDVEIDINDGASLEAKLKPFDQTKIDITMKPMTLDLIINRLRNGEIDLMPDFQRKQGLWDSEKKSRLIESLILRIPLPAFYFDGSNDENWLVIDGLQRLTAIKEFFIDETLKLENLEFLTDYNSCTYKSLPRTYTRRMEETQIIAYIINPGTPTSVKYNIFKRINTAGIQLEPQEIRHALYQGPATELLKSMAKDEMFLLATGGSIKTDRMADREFALRFIAFKVLGIERYEGIIDDYLNETMEYLNNCGEDELHELETQFNKAMKLSLEVFGEHAFRKMFSRESKRKNPINRALFECWSVHFSELSDAEIAVILQRKDLLIDKFLYLMNHHDSFSIDINSGKITAVKRRFDLIGKIIHEVLYDN